MSTSRPTRTRRRLVVVGAAALAVGLVAPHGSSIEAADGSTTTPPSSNPQPTTPQPSSTVTSSTVPATTTPPPPPPPPSTAAATAAIELPAGPEVGQATAMAVTLQVQSTGELSPGTLSMTFQLHRRVAAVDADSFTVTSQIRALQVGQVPAGFQVGALELFDGADVEQRFSHTGARVGDPVVTTPNGTPDPAMSVLVIDRLAALGVGYPTAALAAGDTWTAPALITAYPGVDVEVAQQCRLAEVTANGFRFDVSYSTSFTADGTAIGSVDATVSGSASLRGSTKNPLRFLGSIKQVTDGVATADGVSRQLSLASTVTLSAIE